MSDLEIKKQIVHKIKYIFEKNQKLACYTMFLSTTMFDTIFETYLQEYIGIDLNDVEFIKSKLEAVLNLKLSDFLNLDELFEMYFLCKDYIHILMRKLDR